MSVSCLEPEFQCTTLITACSSIPSWSMRICMILAIKSEVYQDHEVFGDPKHPLYCSISKKLGGVGADVAKIEGTVSELKRN